MSESADKRERKRSFLSPSSWRRRLSRSRQRSRDTTPTTAAATPPNTSTEAHLTTVSTRSDARADELGEPQASHQREDFDPHGSHTVSAPIVSSLARTDVGDSLRRQDLWTAAFNDAVKRLSGEIDETLLQGKKIEQLFKDLEEMGKTAASSSVLFRGVERLKALKVPLEICKLALDLSSPLTSLEPTVKTVTTAVATITGIAISLASLDLEFGKRIGEMVRQISYIDDCDTLGRRENAKGIHEALVDVYMKLLEFYKATFDFLGRKGAKQAMHMLLQHDRLPVIVDEFLKLSSFLNQVVSKVTLEITSEMRDMLSDQKILEWLGEKKPARSGAQHTYLRELAADEACEFLLLHHNFTTWYQDPGSSQLALLGDMGSGKSVTTARLVDYLGKRGNKKLPRPLLCFHYCQDDETGDFTYILSVLTLSLLQQLPGLKAAFYRWYSDKLSVGNFESGASQAPLQEFLRAVTENLDRQLFIVIDGLDECGRKSRKDLLGFLQTLTRRGRSVKIFLSSRPEEEILNQIVEFSKISITADTERDKIIATHTVERELSHLEEKVQQLVIQKLSLSAQGSAIWVKMTVALIELHETTAMPRMRSFLENMTLPDRLSELYDALISKCTSDNRDNIAVAITALKILAATSRPLSILELSSAVTFATNEVQKMENIEEAADARRVLRLIRPFISQPDFNDQKKRQLRLSHLSMKEFIVERCANKPNEIRSRIDASVPTPRQDQLLDAFMMDLCMGYLLLPDINSEHPFSGELMALIELPQGADMFEDYEHEEPYNFSGKWEDSETRMLRFDPSQYGLGDFFVYASCYWIHHLVGIDLFTPQLLANIQEVCAKTKHEAYRLENWTQQYCRPDCTCTQRWEFDSALYDPLSIVSLYGTEPLLKYMLKHSNLRDECFHHETILKAADQILQWGELGRLRTLLMDSRPADRPQYLDFFKLVLYEWQVRFIRHDDWDKAFDLIMDNVDTLLQEGTAGEIYSIASRAECSVLVERLDATSQSSETLKLALQSS